MELDLLSVGECKCNEGFVVLNCFVATYKHLLAKSLNRSAAHHLISELRRRGFADDLSPASRSFETSERAAVLLLC
jgi:hypothetical protein